jgi:hypothetical protein
MTFIYPALRSTRPSEGICPCRHLAQLHQLQTAVPHLPSRPNFYFPFPPGKVNGYLDIFVEFAQNGDEPVDREALNRGIG